MPRKAKNLREYVEAWKFHANNLSILALHADVPYEEYERIRAVIDGWIERAEFRLGNRCDSNE